MRDNDYGFREGDVIVHDVGSETNESTWVRDASGAWMAPSGGVRGDEVARHWLVANLGKLIHRSSRASPPVTVARRAVTGGINGRDFDEANFKILHKRAEAVLEVGTLVWAPGEAVAYAFVLPIGARDDLADILADIDFAVEEA